MTYQLKASSNKKKKGVPIILLTLAVVLVTLSYTGWDNYLAGVFQTLARPFFSIERSLHLASISQMFTSKSSLISENELLKNQILEKNILLLKAKEIEKENDKLREMFGRVNTQKLLLGYVLQKPNHSPYDTLLLDIGSREGVSVGKLVVAYGEVPIGRVAEVYEKVSVVRMFSSPLQEIPVQIGDTKIESVAVGIGGGNFRMLLPKDTPISEGDIVTLSGFDNRILGTVEKINRSEAETFARIMFKSPLSIYELSAVFVVLE